MIASVAVLGGLLVAPDAWAAGPLGHSLSAPEVACKGQERTLLLCTEAAAEDLLLIPNTDWVIASSFRGEAGIRLIHAKSRDIVKVIPTTSKETFDRVKYPNCPGPLSSASQARFHTHGLALRRIGRGIFDLHAIHHGDREAVEIFRVDARMKVPTLSWRGCVSVDKMLDLNAVAPLPGGGFIVTSSRTRGRSAPSTAEILEGKTSGELWVWKPGGQPEPLDGSTGSVPNGVVATQDGNEIFYAEWGSKTLTRLKRTPAGMLRTSVKLGFRPDNLRWSTAGSVIVTGHGINNTRVVSLNPNTLAIEELFTLPDSPAFSGGTSTIEVGDEFWTGSFRSRQIYIRPRGNRESHKKTK